MLIRFTVYHRLSFSWFLYFYFYFLFFSSSVINSIIYCYSIKGHMVVPRTTNISVMEFQGYKLLGFLLLLGSLSHSIAVAPRNVTASLNRNSFPAGFIFGTASASYQVSPWFCTCLYNI